MSTAPEFEWDADEALGNLRKHGVDFADATAVFEDEQALTMPDHPAALDERRFLALGRDALGRILVVAYTWRGDRIRLMSTRRAGTAERRQYRRQGEP